MTKSRDRRIAMHIPLTEGRIFVGGYESAVGYDPTEQEYADDYISDETIASVALLEAVWTDRSLERAQSLSVMRELIAAALANETARQLSLSEDEMRVFISDGSAEQSRPVHAVARRENVVYLDVQEPIDPSTSGVVSISTLRDALRSGEGSQDVVMESGGRLIIGTERVNGDRSTTPRLELLLGREFNEIGAQG